MSDHFQANERRKPLQGNRFGLDKSLNVGNIIAAVSLAFILMGYGSKIVNYLQSMDGKVTVLWQQFIEDHPEKVQQFDALFPKR